MIMYEARCITNNYVDPIRDTDLDRLLDKIRQYNDRYMIFEYELLDYWIDGEDEDPQPAYEPFGFDPPPSTDIYVEPTPYITWVTGSDGTTTTVSASITYTSNRPPDQIIITDTAGEIHVYPTEETSE